MIVWLMRTEGWGYGEALEYVACGIVGSLPDAGPPVDRSSSGSDA